MLSILTLIVVVSYSIVNAIPNKSVNVLSRNNDYFLPNTSVPNHYDLHLNVELGPIYSYNGIVNIDLIVVESVQKLVLHSHDLEINVKNSFLLENDGSTSKRRFDITAVIENSTNHFLTVWFDKQIVPGNYTLRLEFSGHYYNYTNGFFLDSYNDTIGNKKYLLATHFEPVGARHMFPCYDEPNLKATFKVTVTHPRKYNAVSNMPVEGIRIHGIKKNTTFLKTPKMSTYLLAVAVSEYESLQGHIDDKNFSIHYQSGELNAVSFALNITLKSIRKYHDLLKVNYSLPKLDGIVVPLFSGGMENWGLIVYGRSIVPKNSTLSQPMPSKTLRSIVNLISHEVAHQWFGNLVTLDWWDYVWLNEGFATYYSTRASDMIYPNERFMDRQELNMLNILLIDSHLELSDSLNRPVSKPEDILPKFGFISYKKGSAIVKFMQMMFNDYDQAISDYLRKNSYDNADPLDLFESINNRANLRDNLTVQDIMKGWSSNSGYPLLIVNVTERGNISTISFSQKKFTQEKNNSTDKWWIPITLATKSNLDFKNLTVLKWLSDKESSTEMIVRNNVGWVIVNLQKAAYMRVNYDLTNWKRIIVYLKGPNFEKIHHLNRMQLIDDSSKLCLANLLPENINLDLLRYIKQEKDDIVLSAAEISFKMYLELLRGTNTFYKFQAFVIDILGSKRGGNLLKSSNLEELVEKAISENELRHPSLSVSFHEITKNLYTSESLSRVRNILARNQKLNVQQRVNFLENVEKIFMANKKSKENFLKYNYDNVKRWLDSKY